MRLEMLKLRKIMHLTEDIATVVQETVGCAERACNNWDQVAAVAASYAEHRATRQVSDWPADPDDTPLPPHMLRTTDTASSWSNSHGSWMCHIVDGGSAQLVPDDATILAASRRVDLTSEFDNVRRAVAGRFVKTIERDDLHGVVRCHLPGIGDVWFPLAAFAPGGQAQPPARESTDIVTTNVEEAAAAVIEEIESEILLGRNNNQEALRALGNMHATLQRTRLSKRQMEDRVQQAKQRAVELANENKSLRWHFERQQADIENIRDARDKLYEEAKALVQENKKLRSDVR